jgi:hypothetical protein
MSQLIRVALLTLLIVTLTTASAQTPRPKTQPKPAPASPLPLQAVAETRLLMEGLALANFRGLDTLLKEKPADAESWAFARGQALLIAETANLLLLRPPRNDGRDPWINRTMDLRNAAISLARNISDRDYAKSKAGLVGLANACNRCHQTFRVDFRIGPADKAAPKGAKK